MLGKYTTTMKNGTPGVRGMCEIEPSIHKRSRSMLLQMNVIVTCDAYAATKGDGF